MIRKALDKQPPGPIRIVQLCAGQGRDLIGVLADHSRRQDVVARLVELDPDNADHARRSALDAELPSVEVVTADAGNSTAFVSAVPAGLVLACGVFGNVPDADVRRTIAFLPAMCSSGATVIWTRHRKPPDLTAQIRDWFAHCAFEESEFVAPTDTSFGVGAHEFAGEPVACRPGQHLFAFFR